MDNKNTFIKYMCLVLIALMFSMQLTPVLADDFYYDFSDEAQEQFDSQVTNPVPLIPTKETQSKKQNKKTENAEQIQTVNTNTDTAKQNSTLKGGLVYIEEGAVFQAVLQSSISSESLSKNDTIASVLSDDWRFNGVLIAPQGSIVYGKAIDAKKSGGWYKNGEISIVFDELITPKGDKLKLTSNIVTVRVDGSRAKKITTNVAAGAATGIASGALFTLLQSGGDWKRALIVGASIGIAGGLVNAATRKGEDVEIPAGTGINVRLIQPMNAEPYTEEG